MSRKLGGYFDIERDRQIINAGGFFCEACLVGKPADDMSPDPRYCQGCYEFFLKEAETLAASGNKHKPIWIPLPDHKSRSKPSATIPQGGSTIMSTLNGKKSEVDIIPPRLPKLTREKRGPKQKALPHELIMQWAGEGMGSKAIASKLNNELGIKVSYKTIQRVLSGERNILPFTENQRKKFQ